MLTLKTFYTGKPSYGNTTLPTADKVLSNHHHWQYFRINGNPRHFQCNKL